MSNEIIQWGGVAILVVLVFIETGFLLGLIVPGGETMLFAAGLLTATNTLNFPLAILIPILVISGFIGDCMGYWLGMKLGNKLHRKNDSWIFKKQYLQKAEDFYKEHQKTALIIGRFLPIIRTINPLISGSSKLALRKFIPLSAVGSAIYISSLTLAGYLLGSAFPSLGNYVEYIFLGVALGVIATVLFNWLKRK